jgi:uridine phosphorylase
MTESIPLLRHPLSASTAFTPEALVRAVRAERGTGPEVIPPICVLDFDGDLNDWLVKNGLACHCSSWACFHTTMNVVKVDGVDCGIIPRTIGGPYAVLIAEQLCVSGARLIIGLTSAGRVLDSLPVPSLVVATSAIRDEGTSYHYLPPADRVAGPSGIAESLESELRNLDLHVEQGCVWTTDAPYRETAEQFRLYAAEGVLAVEMQAASLFAFAQARRASAGLVAHVTNAIDHQGEPFDKGPEDLGFRVFHAICRAGLRLLSNGLCTNDPKEIT